MAPLLEGRYDVTWFYRANFKKEYLEVHVCLGIRKNNVCNFFYFLTL